MEERLAALYVISQSQVPQMTVFGIIYFTLLYVTQPRLIDCLFNLVFYCIGMTITYGAMGTAAAGLLLALVSRVVLKQLGASGS